MQTKPNFITPGYVFTFALVTCLFFLWALPNVLNDVLIKQFQKSLELSRFEARLIQTAIKLGYFCLAIPAGLFMQRFGYKTGIITGLLIFATGSFLFYPASSAGVYLVFLGGIGSGLAFLELGANSFVTSLGDPSTSARCLNLAQSFNPIGGITGVMLGTLFIFSGNEPTKEQSAGMKAQITATGNAYTDFLQTENARVWPTYILIGLVVLVVAFLIWKTKFPKVETPGDAGQKGRFRALLKYPHWYGAIISQFSTFLMKWIPATRLMSFYALINIILVSIVILGSEWASWTGIHAASYWIGIGAMMATTFFMSLMYLTNFASGVKGLGPHMKLGTSMLIMSLIGGALLTPLIGLVAEASWAKAIAPGMIIPIVSYGVIAWYGFKGSRPRGPIYG